MSKIRLTKGELKRQRDSLEQYRHYLPTLQLKKQQLQIKITETRVVLSQKTSDLGEQEKSIDSWNGLLADPGVDIKPWVVPEKILTDTENIAGASVPVLKDVIFKGKDYDLFLTPLWIDCGIDELQKFIRLLVEVNILEQKISILKKELRVTTQRVNLFEKIKIPEALESIRKIRIYLGDMQSNAVGISKVAKKKIEGKMHEEILV